MKNGEIRKIGKDIFSSQILDDKTQKQIMNKFYVLMRKHGIKQGTKEGNGVTVNNFEWTICFEAFKSKICSDLNIYDLLNDTPKDLRHY